MLLPLITALATARPTYGYRRITAVLNRQLRAEGLAPVNHKRVYRIMQAHSLLLARHYSERPDLAHDGKVVTLRSNLRSPSGSDRWRLDGSLLGWLRVHVLERRGHPWRLPDRRPRPVGHRLARCRECGHSGSDIRDMMLEAVEKRFQSYRALQPVEVLSDNGSAYTAKDTRIFARQLGLRPCFTPVKSPQSNGISEAFVRTLKRDYVQVTPLADAATALQLLPAWLEDYNTHHPHSGLKMRSPREFIAAQTATAQVSGETGVRSRLGCPSSIASGGGSLRTRLPRLSRQVPRAASHHMPSPRYVTSCLFGRPQRSQRPLARAKRMR